MSRNTMPPVYHARRRYRLSVWSLLCAPGLTAVIGCGGTPSDDGQTDRPTLNQNITAAAGEDPIIGPAGVDETPPNVAISAGPGFCCNPLSIELDAQVTGVDSANIVKYSWEFGDDRVGEGPVANHTYQWAGDYEITLKIHLNDGSILTATQTLSLGFDDQGVVAISISPPPATSDSSNEPSADPIDIVDDDPSDSSTSSYQLFAEAGPRQSVVAGDDVVLDGSGSGGSEDGVLVFAWTQADGPDVDLNDSSSAMPVFEAPEEVDEPVLLVFRLDVSQNDLVASDLVEILVNPRDDNVEPLPVVTADAGPDQPVRSGASVTLSAAESFGTGSDPLAYHWTQTWGPAVAVADPYAEVISFTAPEIELEPLVVSFQLVVTQEEVSATDEVFVTVTEDRADPTEAQVLAWLQELDPLPKVHYSYAVEPFLYRQPLNPLMYEFVRITNACSVRTRWPQETDVYTAVEACRQVNNTHPDIPATIALNFSPWHMVFPEDAPPTDMGPDHDAEIEFFRTTAEQFKQWVADANKAYGASIEISAIILESERFFTKREGDDGWQEWNEAIDVKHNAIYSIARELFPDARIERYLRGAIIPCEDHTTWCQERFYTLNEMGDYFSTDFYLPWYVNTMVESFRRNCLKADDHGISSVMPWVSLAAGWARAGERSRKWVVDHDYDTALSWQLGAQINDPYYAAHPEEYAPWDRAEVVCFYPTPFNARIPSWGKHFVAYVRGAHGIEELP